MDNWPTISFIIPTLGREEGLQRCIKSIESLDYPKEKIDTFIYNGDETVPEKVHKGYLESKGEYIVYASNDVEFTPNSIKEALLAANNLKKRIVAFNTGLVYPDNGNACEHFIIKRDLVPLIGGEIFDREFYHVGVDNLLRAKCIKMNEFCRCESAVVVHYHFSKGMAEFDKVYQKGWEMSRVTHDRELLAKKLSLCDGLIMI